MLAVACSSPRNEQPAYAPRPVVELDRWLVFTDGDDGEQRLGEVVELEIQDPQGAVRFYRVLDRAGRWVGHATANGRFSRRVPFEEQEQDLGVWSLPRGVQELFEASTPVTLRPVAREADFDK